MRMLSGAGAMIKLTAPNACRAGAELSVTVTDRLPLKGAAGVPLILQPFATRGLGRPVIVQVYGGVPPVADIVALRGVPTIPVSALVERPSGGGLIVKDRVVEAWAAGVALSVTFTLTLPLNGAEGVPEILHPTAVKGLGKPAKPQLYGGTPPETPTVAE